MNELDITNVNKDPFDQFEEWYSLRAETGIENHNSMVLATSTDDGRVSSRVVLLKKYNKDGFVFFTNYLSKKGTQLSLNPRASLLFYWPESGRQVRIEGSVQKTTATESDEYFDSRIHGHKLNAIISKQSSEIATREELIQRYKEISSSYNQGNPVRPVNWGGYRLVPDLFEFWQEGADRFHDRIEYFMSEGSWNIRRLSP
jgi:pyridoxamine-phosphate oxidase